MTPGEDLGFSLILAYCGSSVLATGGEPGPDAVAVERAPPMQSYWSIRHLTPCHHRQNFSPSASWGSPGIGNCWIRTVDACDVLVAVWDGEAARSAR